MIQTHVQVIQTMPDGEKAGTFQDPDRHRNKWKKGISTGLKGNKEASYKVVYLTGK